MTMGDTNKPPSLNDRVLTLEGKMDGIIAEVKTLITKVDEGNVLRHTERRDAWSKVLGSASVIGGIFAFIVNSMIAEKIMPLQEFKTSATSAMNRVNEILTKQQDLLTRITAENATSIQDRHDMQKLVDMNYERLGKLETSHASSVAHYNASIVEIETQISALEQVGNLRAAYIDRINNITWQLGKLGTYPSDPMPEFRISNRNPAGAK